MSSIYEIKEKSCYIKIYIKNQFFISFINSYYLINTSLLFDIPFLMNNSINIHDRIQEMMKIKFKGKDKFPHPENIP